MLLLERETVDRDEQLHTYRNFTDIMHCEVSIYYVFSNRCFFLVLIFWFCISQRVTRILYTNICKLCAVTCVSKYIHCRSALAASYVLNTKQNTFNAPPDYYSGLLPLCQKWSLIWN